MSCVAHAHWCFHSNSLMTVKSMQHFTEQAQTELAINLLTEKIPKGKRSKVWLYFAQKDSNIATCSKCNKTIAWKEGREGKSQRQISNRRLKNKRRWQLYLTYGSLLKGQYTFSRTQCVQVTRLTINKIEKIGINKS